MLAGIVFLAFEIRQNTVAVRSEALQGLQDQWSSVNEMLMEESMTELFRRGMLDLSRLDEVEYGRFATWWLNALYGWQNAYYQMRAGVYNPEQAEALWRILRSHLDAPGFRQYWNSTGRLVVSSDFREFVERDIMERDPVLTFWSGR